MKTPFGFKVTKANLDEYFKEKPSKNIGKKLLLSVVPPTMVRRNGPTPVEEVIAQTPDAPISELSSDLGGISVITDIAVTVSEATGNEAIGVETTISGVVETVTTAAGSIGL